MTTLREPFVWCAAAAALASAFAIGGWTLASPDEVHRAQRALGGPGIEGALQTGLFVLFAFIDIAADGELNEPVQGLAPAERIPDRQYESWLDDWARSPEVSPAMRRLAGDACPETAPRVRYECVRDALTHETKRRIEARARWELVMLGTIPAWITALVLFVRWLRWRRGRGIA